MNKGIRNFVILATAVLGLTLTACGTGIQVDLSTVTPAQIQVYASSLTPAQLQAYTAALTPAQIQTIAGSLTLAQLQAIAPFLTLVTGSASGIPAAPNGTALYTSICAWCHGPLATSSKLGATLARIQSAISGNTGGMGSYSSLSVADIQAISTALAGTGTAVTPTPTVTDGATLFSTYCASCHNSMGSTSVSSIQSNIKSQSRMNSLSSLTAAQLQAISTYLSTAGGSSKGGGD